MRFAFFALQLRERKPVSPEDFEAMRREHERLTKVRAAAWTRDAKSARHEREKELQAERRQWLGMGGR